MNTVDRPVRMLDREQFLAVRSAWKAHSRSRTATASDHLAYLLLLDRSVLKAFRPVTDPRRLASLVHQGRGASFKLAEAADVLQACFDSAVRYGGKGAGAVGARSIALFGDFAAASLPVEVLERLRLAAIAHLSPRDGFDSSV